MDEKILKEAATILAREEHTSIGYILIRYTPETIIQEVHKLNLAREENMDAVRETW